MLQGGRGTLAKMAPLVETSTRAELPFNLLVPSVLMVCPLVKETKSTPPMGTSIASLDCREFSKRDAVETIGRGILMDGLGLGWKLD